MIGATTLGRVPQLYRKGRAPSPDDSSRSGRPPSQADALEILKGLRDRYEAHHRVQITDGPCRRRRAYRPLHHRLLPPDKAIDVIDEAGARVRLAAMARPPDLEGNRRSDRAPQS